MCLLHPMDRPACRRLGGTVDAKHLGRSQEKSPTKDSLHMVSYGLIPMVLHDLLWFYMIYYCFTMVLLWFYYGFI